MVSRRDLIKASVASGVLSVTGCSTQAHNSKTAHWQHIQQSFAKPEKTTINLLNTGGGNITQNTLGLLEKYQFRAASGGEYYDKTFTQLKESGSSTSLRRQMSLTFGCDIEEVALTRNAMEGLAIGLLGIDLRKGDQIITTNADYDACIQIIKQRQQREGIESKLIDIPMPAANDDEIVSAFEDACNSNTKVILMCHMFNKNGQILPVKKIAQMARRKGIITIVDGAQSIGHFDFKISDLDCDIFAASLHKWFYAPRGTGLLYIRQDMISNIWPIWASWSGKPSTSIEKFEEFGTVSKPVAATLNSVFQFHRQIGSEAKEHRLRELRDYWLSSIMQSGRIQLLTNLAPSRSCGIAAFKVDGIAPDNLAKQLSSNYNIDIGSIHLKDKPQFEGNYLAADLTNTEQHLEQFVSAFRKITKKY